LKNNDFNVVSLFSGAMGLDLGVEKAGFNVRNVPEELREKHFSEKERDIKHASIGREEFLEKWLKE